MTEELAALLESCVAALASRYESTSADPKCWLDWLSCISQFVDGEYGEAATSAAALLTQCRLNNWFVALQVLLISLKHLEGASSLSIWGDRLAEASAPTPWQRNLLNLTLNRTEISPVLATASDGTQVCQANYYFAECLLCAGDATTAMELLQNCGTSESKCIEQNLARKRIEMIGSRKFREPGPPAFSVSVTTSYKPASTEPERQKLLRQDSGGALLTAVSKLFAGESPAMISLRADDHRRESWTRIVQRVVQSGVATTNAPEDKDFQWLPRKGRMALADAYKEEFLKRIEELHLLQDHPFLNEVQLIGGSELLLHSRFPEYRDVKSRLVSYGEKRGTNQIFFLSHRWITYQHPDPHGVQLQMLRRHIRPEAFYWIDYSCLPQKPRTPEEEAVFRESLSWIPSLFFGMQFLILRYPNDGYVGRAWCFVELLAATVLGRTIHYIVEGEHGVSSHDGDDRKVLEQTLDEMDMPPGLGTSDPADLDPIRRLIQNVVFFFNLRVVENYMTLGQHVSDGRLFFAEDPYYLVAVCDLSNVILWLFERVKLHGMKLLDLSHSDDDEDFLLELARKEDFSEEPCSDVIPTKVSLDESRFKWFSENRHRSDSPCRLFYKLTSLIK